MTACTLFVEPCCGSAAVALKLLGGPKARPPVSYMGGKTGYAAAILHTLGLRQGQGADAVLLNDPGPWAMVWRVLVDPEGCRRVAAIIRGWVGEDGRALWGRLRAELVPDDEEEAAARWVCLQHGNLGAKEVTARDGAWKADAYAVETEAAKAIGFRERLSPELRAAAVSRLRFPPGTLVLGEAAANVTPEAVARWLYLVRGSFSGKDPAAGIGHPDGMPASERFGGVRPAAEMLDTWLAVARSWPPVGVANLDASAIHPEPPLPEGTFCYLDPPYLNTTGYAHKFSRPAVLEVAQRWADAGARVAVSEAEPLDLPGWHHVEITGCRVGQKRTFSRQRSEWLTLSHPPAWQPAGQTELF